RGVLRQGRSGKAVAAAEARLACVVVAPVRSAPRNCRGHPGPVGIAGNGEIAPSFPLDEPLSSPAADARIAPSPATSPDRRYRSLKRPPGECVGFLYTGGRWPTQAEPARCGVATR